MIALSPSSDFTRVDLEYSGGCLLDSGLDLETAVLISLGTNAQRVGPKPADEPRAGWWGDSYARDVEGADFSELGSLLWTLDSVDIKEAAALAPQYASTCLQWLIDDGHVKSVSTTARVTGGLLFVDVQITKLNGALVTLSPFKVGAA